MVAPLGPLHVTLVCRGTPVENHWCKLSTKIPTDKLLFSARLIFLIVIKNQLFHNCIYYFSFDRLSNVVHTWLSQYLLTISWDQRWIKIRIFLCFGSLTSNHRYLSFFYSYNNVHRNHSNVIGFNILSNVSSYAIL